MKKFYVFFILLFVASTTEAQLTGISPNSSQVGQTLQTTITSNNLFQVTTSPSGNIQHIELRSGSNFIYAYNPNNTIVMSPNEVQTPLTIPISATPGVYNLHVYTDMSQYTLPSAFVVFPSGPTTLSGLLYIDGNQNGIYDSGEFPVENERVFLSPDSVYVYSSSNGTYFIGAQPGTHDISFSSVSGIYTQTSSPTVYSFTNSGDSSGFDFGLRYTTPDYTSAISFSHGFLRCNVPVTSTITYQNKSNIVSQGEIMMILSSNMSFVSSSPAISSQSGDTLFWNFTGLQPGESRTISFVTSMPGFGSSVSFYAIMNATDGSGNVMFSTDDDLSSNVACAYDPNDKSCNPAGVNDSLHYTLFSDTLEYLIRFQNTGNDTAFNILILDTIDAALDLSTLELLDVSHPMQFSIDNNRTATFRFDNILLPDSNVDEPGSHGYILYRIRPHAGLPDPTRVENTAYIFFDFNPAIVTNTTWNTLVTMIPVSVGNVQADENGVVFYPNPMTNSGTFYFENDNQDLIHFELMDINGRVVISGTSNSEEIKINRDGLSSGMYLYKLLNSTSGSSMNGKIIIE